MKTVRVSDQIYEEILAQKRGNDTINDIIMRWYLGYLLLQKTFPEELVKLKGGPALLPTKPNEDWRIRDKAFRDRGVTNGSH